MGIIYYKCIIRHTNKENNEVVKLIHYVHIFIVLAAIATITWDIVELDNNFFLHLITIGNLIVLPPNGCLLTRLENIIRRKKGAPEISGWIKHYFINFKQNRGDWI
jgi:hypothetical protein